MPFTSEAPESAQGRPVRRRARAASLLAAVTLAGLGALSAPASAQTRDAVSAEVLFQKGLAEMKAGRYDTGCPLIEESNKLDPRPGTTFTLAECENARGRLATAAAHYEEYLRLFSQMSRSAQRKQHRRDLISKKHLEELGPKIPRLTVRVPEGAPETLEVLRDGQPLARPTWGIALPVDPGEHRVEARVPGGPAFEARVSLGPGEKKAVDVELRPPAPKRVALAPAPAPRPAPENADEPGSTRRVLTWTAGGVGAAGLVVGVVTGALALARRDDARAHCAGPACDAEGKRAGDAARALASVSTVGFVVGIAGLGTAATLALTAPDGAARRGKRGGPALSAAVDPVGRSLALGVGGAF